METNKPVEVEEKKTTMNVSITAEDKKFLKVYAAENETTIAALIHEYIESLRKEVVK